jgi:acetyl esterase/lipase
MAISAGDQPTTNHRWFRRARRVSGGILLSALAAGCSPTAPLNALTSHQGLKIDRSVAYGPKQRQTLDVYRPVRSTPAPVVVFFYGGSWQSGRKEDYLFAAAALAKRGYLVVVPDYRLYPDVKYPAFLEDGAMAIAWAKRNARRLGGDPRSLFVMGHSAGAYIAAMLTIDNRWLAAVRLSPKRDVAGLIGLSGPYDFLPLRDDNLKMIFGGSNRADTQPISYVSGDEPPSLLATGTSDSVVDPGNSTRLANRLRAAGDKATVISYPNKGHLVTIGAFAGSLRFLAPVLDDVDGFISRIASQRAPS